MLPLPPILVSSCPNKNDNEAMMATPFIDLKPQDFMLQEKTEGEQGRKRTRTLMSPFQTRVLRRVLQKTAFPSITLRNSLSKLLGVPSRTIQIWFQNQRQKARQQRQCAPEPLDVLASVASKTRNQFTESLLVPSTYFTEPLAPSTYQGVTEKTKEVKMHLRPWL